MGFIKNFLKSLTLKYRHKKQLVIGIGGGGCNITDFIASQHNPHIETIGINTDLADLKGCLNLQQKIIIKTYKGLGLGGNPDLLHEINPQIIAEIVDLAKQNHYINLVACLGGGTGSGLTSLLASALSQQLKPKKIKLFVTLPFYFEGKHRMAHATDSIEVLSRLGLKICFYNNDSLVTNNEVNEQLLKTFEQFNQQIYQAISQQTNTYFRQ